MGFKNLSDFYSIQASATPDSTTDQSSVQTVTIDTGLDSLRREVLGIYTVQMSMTTSDDGQLMLAALEPLREIIDAGADSESVRYGSRAALYNNDTGVGFPSEGMGDTAVIAVDGSVHETVAWNSQIGSVGDSIEMTTASDSLRFPQQYDSIVANQPIAYVTSSGMNFSVGNFIDGVAPSVTYGGVTWGIKIVARRLQADAELFAAILTGNA